MLTMSYMAPSVFCTAGTMVGGAEAPAPPVTPVPVNTVAPALDDTTVGVGDTVSVSTGTWTNSPSSYAYQWKRDGVSIGSATSNSYLVAVADVGAVLTCAVTATNAGGASGPATSNATDVVPGGFVPTDIAGCVLWLDASQIVGLSDGDPVATWADLSGNANDETQSDGTKRPLFKTGILNARPVVRFDGSNDFLSAPGLSAAFPSAVFVVHTWASLPSGYVAFSDTGNAFARYTGKQSGGHDFIAYSTGQITSSIVPIIGGSYVYAAVFDGSGALVSINGTVTTGSVGGASGGGTGMTVGAANGGLQDWFPGDIAEVIVYDSALGTTDREAVEAYLMDKYGL